MVFKCQEDSFLKQYTSTVISCTKSSLDTTKEGKKSSVNGYEIILKDTILFPEGGGQPCDYGFLNDKPVFQVTRKEDKAIIFVTEPFNVGDSVEQKVDWPRRFDHMQQHSGQHLITAIIDREFKFPTVSWWLGEEVSHIELDTPFITPEQISSAEEIVNELIRSGKKVSVEVIKESNSANEIKARTRGLPDDHKGDIRIITIEDVESNMCCGTHVTNLSQLQVIKLLHSEKSKRKNKTLLYFLVGNRVLKKLSSCLEREAKLTTLLNNNPNQHYELVERLQKNTKLINKNLQSVLKELAIAEAQKLKNSVPHPKFFIHYKKEADVDYINTFLREINDTETVTFLFLAVGDEKTTGNIVLYGQESDVQNLGNQISNILEGKGAGKGKKFQAKVTKMANMKKAEELIKNHFK
ncbi:alanyl-tRNA editing protein Aarsd1-B-like [Agrilus planipennis]|uniref:Alanyl-tRNA editing protein Aarsd1-B n=1 Tax=Agrilus planipennis TaxID=224129 RepID=A0A7F5R4M4_AGRPL|nr:alanyl-tRNA editing protein Aarsd1-B [Agrilus planipennis]XP_025830494.1 alanyl-tRNA editing protein Aarsd1-B [Agrilus planipennis]XP_025830496.1 alanyl-tRNA editing protein Aarsd1-B-like [Agrilus planipennis]